MLGICGAIVLTILVLYTGFYVARFFRVEENVFHKALFCLGVSVPILVLLADWPGFISYDDFVVTQATFHGHASLWQSLSYSFLVAGAQTLFRQPFCMSLINLLLYMQLLILLLGLTNWRFKSGGWLALAFFFVWPLSSFLVFHQIRDSIYNLLLLILMLSCLYDKYGNNQQYKLSGIYLFLILCVMSDIRLDGLWIIVGGPLLLWIYRGISRGRAIALGVAVATFWLALLPVKIEMKKNDRLFNSVYSSIPLSTVTSYIVHRMGPEKLTKDQWQAIDDVMGMDALLKYKDFYDAAVFLNLGFREGVTIEKFDRFKKVSWQLIWENPVYFLESRWFMFTRVFNIFEVYQHGDALRGPLPVTLSKIADELNVQPKKNEISGPIYLMRTWLYVFKDRPLIQWFSLGIGPIVILLGFLLYRKASLVIWPWAFVLLGRGLGIALITPSAYPRYITSTFVGAWILLIIYVNRNPECLAFLDKLDEPEPAQETV